MTTTHTQVSGELEDGTLVCHSAFDWDSLALGVDRFFSQHDPALLDANAADKRSDSLLFTLRRHRLQAAITVPSNVGHELHDGITVPNPRCGLSGQLHRLRFLGVQYSWRQGRCHQQLGLSAP